MKSRLILLTLLTLHHNIWMFFNINNIHFGNMVKESKGAKIRNRDNQVPHLTQDTNGKVTNSQ